MFVSTYLTIAAVVVVFVMLAKLAFFLFENYATVMPAEQIQEPVQWAPISARGWLFCALVQAVLFVVIPALLFA